MQKSQEFLRRALDLSLAIYRVTAQFPREDVLGRQMRELGNQIAAELSSANATLSAAGDIENLKKSINCLRVYFQIAKAQNWVKPINWSILDFEYYKLQREVVFELGDRGLTQMGNSADLRGEEKEASIMSHNIKASKKSVGQKLFVLARTRSNLRQSKILASLDKNSSLKMSDLIPLFKDDTSERTLRNELQLMVKSGLIKKNGNRKATMYRKA